MRLGEQTALTAVMKLLIQIYTIAVLCDCSLIYRQFQYVSANKKCITNIFFLCSCTTWHCKCDEFLPNFKRTANPHMASYLCLAFIILLAFRLWNFSSSLESLDDDDVELDPWNARLRLYTNEYFKFTKSNFTQV